MSEREASRTLVKSPPELWAECSDARSLARHLGAAVGEIRIKRLEPETTVAWEGEQISGTVRLEPSGWGTKVTLTASAEAEVVADAPVAAPEPVPVAAAKAPESEPATPEPPAPQPPRAGLIARFRRWFAGAPAEPVPEPAEPVPAPKPVAGAPPEPKPEREPIPEPEPAANGIDLPAALDSLGKAHHRPFSRA